MVLVLTSGLHPDHSGQTCQRSLPRLAAHIGIAQVTDNPKSSLRRRKQPFFDAATQRDKIACVCPGRRIKAPSRRLYAHQVIVIYRLIHMGWTRLLLAQDSDEFGRKPRYLAALKSGAPVHLWLTRCCGKRPAARPAQFSTQHRKGTESRSLRPKTRHIPSILAFVRTGALPYADVFRTRQRFHETDATPGQVGRS